MKKKPLTRRAKAILNAKSLLEIIQKNPGITKEKLEKKADFVGESLSILQKNKLVRFEQAENKSGPKPLKWYAVQIKEKSE